MSETTDKPVANITPEIKGCLEAALSYNEEMKSYLINLKSKYSNKDKVQALNEVLGYVIRNGAEMKKILSHD